MVYAIRLLDILETHNAFLYSEGDKVNKHICDALKAGKKIKISFESIEELTAGFVNGLFGDMYRDYHKEFIDNYLILCDLSDAIRIIIKRYKLAVLLRNKDPEVYDNAINEILES